MLVEKLEKFKKVIDLAKAEKVNVQSNEFIVYLSILNSMEEREFTDNEIAELIDRVIDINLDTDSEYASCSIAEIVDYCIENYEDIDDMDNTEILEDICC